ncbi:hypothetical protein BOH72_18275 [Mycobacterium sp. WY10]|nr:hypothetical protein BOH72_18275 [Mycobacterium sp. WY10]
MAAAPAAVGAAPETLPVLSGVGVQPVSFVTDALYSAGDAVTAVTNAIEIGVDLAVGLNYYWDDSDYGVGVPVNPVSLLVAALQNPGSAASYLAQLLLNPSDNYTNYTYPWYFKVAVVEQLVNVLPAALSAPIVDAINNIADGIDSFFAANLPDPTPTVDYLAGVYGGQPGLSVYALQNALAVPTQVLSALTYYVAYLPANLEATLESAIQTPADIPGLLSNLVHQALDPDLYDGLLGNLAWIVTKPFYSLPSPISDVVDNIYTGFTTAVNNILSKLPTPITPTPFASAAVAAAKTPAASTEDELKAAAITEDSASAEEQSIAKADDAATDEAVAAPTKARGQAPATRKAAPDKKSVKQSQAGKSDGGPAGSHGRSARPGKADTAA